MGKAINLSTWQVAVTFLLLLSTPLFASEADDRIEISIKHSYVFKTFVNGDDVKIQSKDGAVTVSGTVFEESHKLLAGETVSGQPGVIRFDNNLAVQGEIPAVNSNEWLKSRVKSTLWYHKNVNATETEVITKDGTVILRGEVGSTAQKDLTTEYAKDVEGVERVKNEMIIVSSEAMNPNGKAMKQKMNSMAESIDDASISALVKSTLRHHRSTSALHTTVKTVDGIVRLGGKARNASEKDLASKLVNDVRGVKMVVNDMIIE